jgi:hypothetical protein
MDMRISNFQIQNLTSVKQALGMANLQKAMSQDQQSVDAVVKMMEQSVNPHLGQNIDLKL